MRLVLERLQLDPDVTIGSLTVEGGWVCWTLEDTLRKGPKVAGQTAIPYGTYPVALTFSPRFKRDLPLVEYVPNFSGVRIHPGNTVADTDGCILVGLDRFPKSLGRSRAAFDALMAHLWAAQRRHEPITLQIVQGA